MYIYRGAVKSLARPGRKQAWKHVRIACDFNKNETRAVIKFLFLQGKAPKKINAILTETLTFSFLVGLRTYQLPCIIISQRILIVIRNVSDKVVEKIKTRILSSITLCRKACHL